MSLFCIESVYIFICCRKISVIPINLAETLSLTTKEAAEELETDEFCVWALSLTLQLLCDLSTLYKDHSSFQEIFHPISVCLASKRLLLDRYSECVEVC